MDLQRIFQNVATQMLSDFESAKAAVHHSGLKGAANEQTVKLFLRKYLPNTIEISSGIVVDSNGNQSKQIDIILHDANRTPYFFESAETRVIPVEGVYAAVEIKADFNASEQQKAFQNMQSFKSLKKLAYFPNNNIIQQIYPLFGNQFDSWPLMYFVFAFDSPSLDSVVSNLNIIQNQEPPHQRIDSVCILKNGVIMNQDSSDGRFSALPKPGSHLVGSQTDQPLFLFYTIISVILTQADSRPFNIIPYIAQANIAF